MITLGFDSTASVASVAVYDGERVLGEYKIDNGLTQSELLLPMAESLMKSLKLEFSQIELLGVNVGPGSFTGVRIGVATVKGLAFGKDKKCVGVSTIEALAQNLEGFEGIVCPIMNARRGQVYTGAFLNGTRIVEDRCMMLCDLIPMLEKYSVPIYFVGDGYSLIEKMENPLFAKTPEVLRYQNAFSVGKVAYNKLMNGEFTTDEGLRVEYLRKAQAEREREEKLEREKNNE